MVIIPATKALRNPTKKIELNSIALVLLIRNIPAPKIIGVASKKENLAADSRFKSENRPAAIVMPEREIPGMIASAWAMPMSKDSFIPISLIVLFNFDFLSEANKAIDPMIKAIDIISGLRKVVSATVSNNKPAITAGMLANPIYKRNRLSEGSFLRRAFLINIYQSLWK